MKYTASIGQLWWVNVHKTVKWKEKKRRGKKNLTEPCIFGEKKVWKDALDVVLYECFWVEKLLCWWDIRFLEYNLCSLSAQEHLNGEERMLYWEVGVNYSGLGQINYYWIIKNGDTIFIVPKSVSHLVKMCFTFFLIVVLQGNKCRCSKQ